MKIATMRTALTVREIGLRTATSRSVHFCARTVRKFTSRRLRSMSATSSKCSRRAGTHSRSELSKLEETSASLTSCRSISRSVIRLTRSIRQRRLFITEECWPLGHALFASMRIDPPRHGPRHSVVKMNSIRLERRQAPLMSRPGLE